MSSIRHRLGSNQEYQSLPSSAIFGRLLDRMLPAPQVVDQFEIKVAPKQWLRRGVTEGVTNVMANVQKQFVSGDDQAAVYVALGRTDDVFAALEEACLAPSGFSSRAEGMLAQGQEMFTWIPNAYVKYPCTHEGSRAAEMSVHERIRVNMTLCFSQAQAAAVHAATRGSKEPVYVSPFVGRLDDQGEDGMDLVRNIKKMYERSDGHVHGLAASIRSISHLLCSFFLDAELATVPSKVLQEWAAEVFPMPDHNFKYKAVDAKGKVLTAIPYQDLDLNLPWDSFDLAHELTTKGIQKFVADDQSTLRRSA